LARQRVLVEQAEQFAALARATLEADDASHPAIVDAEAGQQVAGAAGAASGEDRQPDGIGVRICCGRL
jgi:hypothetical protein